MTKDRRATTNSSYPKPLIAMKNEGLKILATISLCGYLIACKNVQSVSNYKCYHKTTDFVGTYIQDTTYITKGFEDLRFAYQLTLDENHRINAFYYSEDDLGGIITSKAIGGIWTVNDDTLVIMYRDLKNPAKFIYSLDSLISIDGDMIWTKY
jgi:hypothetical protein